jgi:uncharacterized iron-regulated membrane protein
MPLNLAGFGPRMNNPVVRTTVAPESIAARGWLYKLAWRWHFLSGLIVVPFVLWQAITGTIYLWHEEISDVLHSELRFVPESAAQTSLDLQVSAALNANPGAIPASVLVPSDANRSTMLMFKTDLGLSFPAFVDPHTGRYLGHVPVNYWLSGLTRSLHGGWPLGKAGSWLLEIGACFAIVMILTGLYLWLPRTNAGVWGLLLPRLRAGKRIFWRDLHSVVGVYVSVFTLVFLLTALPWTDFWGQQILKPVQHALGQDGPPRGTLKSTLKHEINPMQLQEAVVLARAQGLTGPLEIRLGQSSDSALSVNSKQDRASDERAISFDRYSRAVLAQTNWEDFKLMPKAIATGVDLHEGSYFGRTNQWFNTALSMALIWLSVTGVIGWWKRRPAAVGRGVRLAKIPPAPKSIPYWLLLLMLCFCVVLPLLGLTVAVVIAIEAARVKLVADQA